MNKSIFILIFIIFIASTVFGQNINDTITGKWQTVPSFTININSDELKIEPSHEIIITFYFYKDGTGTGIDQKSVKTHFNWNIENNKIWIKHSGLEYSAVLKLINQNTIIMIEQRTTKQANIAVFTRVIDD